MLWLLIDLIEWFFAHLSEIFIGLAIGGLLVMRLVIAGRAGQPMRRLRRRDERIPFDRRLGL